jgi:hypothetical protein
MTGAAPDTIDAAIAAEVTMATEAPTLSLESASPTPLFRKFEELVVAVSGTNQSQA